MELTDSLKALFVDTARSLKGSARRLLMARPVKELGVGGQRRAARALGWSRVTMRKGIHALESGFRCLDAFSARGRKRAEDHLPSLLTDITAIVESQSQTDPQFRTARLSTRLRAAAVRRQRIVQQGSTDAALPTVQTLTTQRNALGYYPTKVAKSQPPKKFPKRTPSSTRCTRSSRPLMQRTPSCASPWMPKPRSKLAYSPAAGRTACRCMPPTTILPLRRRSRPWASSCPPWASCVCRVSCPQ